MGQIHFKRLDPTSLLQVGAGVAEADGVHSSFNKRLCIGNYLWKRGQNPLLSPAECLHVQDRVIRALNPLKPNTRDHMAALPNINEIKDTQVNLKLGRIIGSHFGLPSEDTAKRALAHQRLEGTQRRGVEGVRLCYGGRPASSRAGQLPRKVRAHTFPKGCASGRELTRDDCLSNKDMFGSR